MKGYYKDPAATEQAFKGGYFWSGDAAVVHPDGYMQIRDRLKDVIISGGENTSSVEVEATLYRHPDVAAAAVVARPRSEMGRDALRLRRAARGAQRRTRRASSPFGRERLAGFKTPKSVIFTEIPKTATGKIQKFKLRAQIKNME